ncbi:MAG: MmgE/PrpD family protein [Candidatus Rokubacteria bacterium]|nr:MmgE/PrpD family protein [Candidatus Rokubacteria bacterium]MBI3825682.1 MmgE/PrpD family protein [Candidatus Rokubacteria bacterium]
MPDYLDRLAAFARALTFATLSPSAIAAARRVVLDTCGAMLAGSRRPENTHLARLVAERSRGGRASLVGHALHAEPMLAALANATAGVSLEVDEGNRWGGGHPAIHVLPAALAVAEEVGADGPRLIEALVAGYEIVSRIGGATQARANVHSHGTWGTLGAAVATAKLLGEPALGAVVNLAASMSPANTWTPCFEGATIRNLYPGRSSLQGILAAHLHRCGFTGVADGPGDVYGSILADGFEPERAVHGLGEAPLRIEANYFKFHACCLYNHPALDAVEEIRGTARFEPGDVARVSVRSIPFVTRMAEPAPAAMLAAKFSIPYAVAAALVLGRTDVTAFTEDVLEDPGVRALAKRVEVTADPAMSLRRDDQPVATVTVTLTDGRTLSRSTRVVRGDAANPRPEEELVAKFLALAAPVLGEQRAANVVALTSRLERVGDVRELSALLSPPAVP